MRYFIDGYKEDEIADLMPRIETAEVQDCILAHFSTNNALMWQMRTAVKTSQPPESNGGYAPHVTQAALFFVRKAQDFATGLDESLVFAGT